MSEAVEYRIAKLQAELFQLGGALLVAIGSVGGLLGTYHESLPLAIVGVLFVICGIFSQLHSFALISDGTLRRVFKRLSVIGSGAEEDPPLQQWYDDLEARGEFEISESDLQ